MIFPNLFSVVLSNSCNSFYPVMEIIAIFKFVTTIKWYHEGQDMNFPPRIHYNGGTTCQLPLKSCEPFMIFMFQIWDLADTDGKGILNKQVWLFM